MIKYENVKELSIFDNYIEKVFEEFFEYLPLCSKTYQQVFMQKIISIVQQDILKNCIAKDLYTATDIANMLNISKQKVGKIANELNLKNNKKYVVSYIIKINEQKYSKIYFYNKKALKIIQNYLHQKSMRQAENRHNI